VEPKSMPNPAFATTRALLPQHFAASNFSSAFASAV
jgi:hypothetical protein